MSKACVGLGLQEEKEKEYQEEVTLESWGREGNTVEKQLGGERAKMVSVLKLKNSKGQQRNMFELGEVGVLSE